MPKYKATRNPNRNSNRPWMVKSRTCVMAFLTTKEKAEAMAARFNSGVRTAGAV